MNILKWLFGRQDAPHLLTEAFITWKEEVMKTKLAAKKMGNRPKHESEKELLLRYLRSTRKSPFLHDEDFAKARAFVTESGSSLGPQKSD